MNMIVEELRLGKRPIVTNLAVEKWPWATKDHKINRGLVDYLLEKYDDTFNCEERIFRISTEAIQNFYLYRALSKKQVAKLGDEGLPGFRKVTLDDKVMEFREFVHHREYALYVADHVMKTEKNGKQHCQSFDARLLELSGPHFSVADECWKFWPARGWQATSEADVEYNAQHRHYGDDNLFLTQRENDIDSIIVDRCQESIVMTHHGKMTFGWFRQQDYFRESVFHGRPKPSKEPMTTHVFRLDVKGLAQCYDTSAGVGITGRASADVGARKTRGLPFWMMPVIVLALLFAAGYGIKGGAGLLVGMVDGTPKKPATVQAKASPAPVTNSPAVMKPAVEPVAEVLPPVETNEVFCTGFTILGKDVVVFLSDGSMVASSSGRVSAVMKDSVTIDGKTIAVRKANLVAPVAQLVERSRPTMVYEPEPAEVVVRESPGIVVTPAIGGRAKPARISGLPQN